jgi:hypothetical protein
MYDGALDNMDLTTDPFTGSQYAFGNGNPVSNIELNGHMPCDGDVCGSFQYLENYANKQELQQAQSIVSKSTASASAGGGGNSAGHEEAVGIAEAEIILMMSNQYSISLTQAFNGIQLGQKIQGGSKYGNGKYGYADITFTYGNNTQIWEAKSSGVQDQALGDAQAVAADEVQGYIRAFNATSPGKTAAPGESLPAPITAPLGPGDISVYSPAALKGAPPDGAILYSSQQPPAAPAPKTVPATQPAPNYAPAVAAGAATAGTAAGLWWLGKLASPACGPLVVACAFAF